LDLELNLFLSVHYFGNLLVLNFCTMTLRRLREWRYQVCIVFLTIVLY
jgi:hypothetical protein